MSMRNSEKKTMAMAHQHLRCAPQSCSTKLNSWAKWLALLIRPSVPWLAGPKVACHESAQANGQIVNVGSSVELTCQTDYMSWSQPKATHTTDGPTARRADWLVGSLWHRVAFRFHCQLTLLQLHSATVLALAPVASPPRSDQMVQLAFVLWPCGSGSCLLLSLCFNVAASRTVSTLFTRPVLSLLQIEIVATLARFMSARSKEKDQPRGGEWTPLHFR